MANQWSTAEIWYAERRLRNRIFNSQELFGEPAWDILLELYISRSQGKTISIKSLCLGTGLPTSTGLRWLAHLEQSGLVMREQDPTDKRRVFVTITDTAVERMEQVMHTAAKRDLTFLRPPNRTEQMRA
jgi:DNA-binding MarR family transcriptional regulator